MRPDVEDLKSERVQDRLEAVPNWQSEWTSATERKAAKRSGETLPELKAIRRGFLFSCFLEAMAFIDRVADLAWEMGVTPAIFVHDDYVDICLPGNRKGVSHADVDFAEVIDSLVD